MAGKKEAPKEGESEEKPEPFKLTNHKIVRVAYKTSKKLRSAHKSSAKKASAKRPKK